MRIAWNMEIRWNLVISKRIGSYDSYSQTYKVADYVEIRGNKGYFYDADGNLKNTTSNSRNDILATILYEGAFSDDDSWNYGMYASFGAAAWDSDNSLEHIYSKAQLGLWYYMSYSDGWNGYSNDNGTNPTWSIKAPSNNDMGKEAFEQANVEHNNHDYGIDMYRLTSSSYQDILLVYPASSEGGSSSTNTPTDYTVGKEWWYDEGSGMQPSAIEVTLLGNGELVSKDIDGNTIDNPIILDSSYSKLEYYKSIDTSGYYDDDCSDLWVHVFENLPTKDSSGNTITYTATESVAYSDEQDKFDAYYQSRYYGSNYYIFYNCLYTDISVKKEWDDNNDQDGKRPTSITVQLYANGEEYVNEYTETVVTLNESNSWAGEFQYLPQYINGEKVEYTVKEAEVEGYTSNVSGDASSGFTITNTYIPEKNDIEVTKTWNDENDRDGKRPNSITVNLMANGTQIETATLSGTGNEWTHTFKELETYESGEEIEYTIEEVEIEGYTSTISGDASSGFIITNTYTPEKINIDVTKKWEDNNNANNKRSSSITVNLMTNGTQVETATLSGTGNEWTYTFNDLYKYEAGEEIEYKIEEIEVEGYTTEITGNQTSGFIITNKQEQIIIDIKGIVWNDGAEGKANNINGVFVENSSDKGLGGIRVELLDANGDTIKATYSDENGELTRTDYAITKDDDGSYIIRVENTDLTGAYVRFEYDGMTYTTVKPNVETYKDGETTKNATSSQQSKAVEDEDARDKFDEGFPNVTSSNIEDVQEYIGNMKITALTKEVISLNEEEQTQEDGTDIKVIENVNLGLFEREQPNVAIFSDLTQVKVTMNGQEYTYLYGVRSNKYNPEDADYLQVKFQNKDTYTYKRPVNPADIAYLNETDNSDKEMEVLVTYKIKVANLSTTLVTTVNEIVNVYDSQYKEITEIKKGENTISYSNTNVYETQDEFKQIMMTGLNIVLQPGSESENITITYKVSADAVKGLLSEEPTLNNAVEICSYSTTYGENTLYAEQRPYEGEENARKDQPYAGYDYDSIPGNAEIKYSETYKRLEASYLEDDTDIAPSFILCKDDENPKTLSGTVWEDADTGTRESERIGNGKIDEGENWAENVKVEIYATNGSEAKLYNSADPNDKASTVVYTDANGEYRFPGIVTGEEYIVKFTYGNYDEEEKTYNETNGKETSENNSEIPLKDATKIEGKEVNARNYKSTIITEEIVRNVIEGTIENKKWLIEHEDNHSVAVDDIDDRLSIPDLKNGNFYDGINMTAYTKSFIVPLEFDYTGETNGNSNKDGIVVDKNGTVIENELSKLDFGIIERPREDLVVQKTITNFKITLANGQELTEGDPRNSEVNMSYVKTMGFVEARNIKDARLALEKQLLVEMDTELIQGAKMDVTYEIKVINNNEIDYDYGQEYGKEYYYYGTVPTGKTPIPSTIQFVDYLDKELSFNQEENGAWDLVTKPGELKDTGYISAESLEAIQKYGYKVLQTEGETEGSKKITIESKGEYTFTEVKTTKILANKDENVYDNNAEIIEIDGKTARTVKGKDENEEQLIYIPGNYEPGEEPEYSEPDDDRVKIIITPPTGITNNIISYIVPILVGLIVIFVGIIFIKKKVLNS